MEVSWKELAEIVESVYGGYVDWDEEFFICPECNEIILSEDFPHYSGYMCPVCENILEDEYE